MLKDFSTIIWDWNGTLLNDGWLCHELGNVQLERQGLAPISIDDYRKRFRHPVQYFYADLGFDFTGRPFSVLSEEFHYHYEQRRSECGLQPGARQLLVRLHAACKRQMLLSAQHSAILIKSIQHFEVASLFEEVRGLSDTLAFSKVELGRRLISESRLNASQVVLIGDTLHDFEVAKELGLSSILVSHGYQDAELLAATGAPVVSGLEELLTPSA